MNLPVKLLLSIFALFIPVQHVIAEEWRGIVPLKSTRQTVARLFGECANAERLCEFVLPNEGIRITLSTNECPEGVPTHTVLMIERQLQNGTTLAALGLEKRRFKTFNPWYPGNNDYRAYIDEESGLLLKSLRGEIFQINYIPPKRERQVCAGYFRRPKEFVRVFPEHVPTISLECPESTTFAGDKIAITAVYPDTGQRTRLTWETTGGRIIEQRAKGIILDTSGFDGQTITVSVERDDGHYHKAMTSCVVRISPKPGD